MPILEIGTYKMLPLIGYRRQQSKRSISFVSQQGFTLIELLIVMVIMSLLYTTAILSLDRTETQQLTEQGEQLHSWLSQLRNEAILSSTILGAVLQDKRVFAVIQIDNKWRPSTQIEALTFESVSLLNHDFPTKDDQDQPHVLFLPTGQVLPPQWRLFMNNDQQLMVTQTEDMSLQMSYP